MKKILVLIALITMSVSAFAEPVILADIKSTETIVLTDTRYEELQKDIAKDIAGFTDEKILCELNKLFCNMYESKGKASVLERYEIKSVESLAEKYGIVIIGDYKGEWPAIIVNLGDGRQITMLYYLQNK